MKLKPTASKNFDADLAPAGTHAAVCVGVIDLGTHTPLQGYQGKPPTPTHKLLIIWELVEEATRPIVWADFTASLNENAKLRGFLTTWRGKDIPEGEEFDLMKLKGVPCLIAVEHTKSKDGKRTHAKVGSATPPMKGMKFKVPQRDPFTWDLSDREPFRGPTWDLPFWYGRPIEDVIADCAELKPAPDAALMGNDADRDEADDKDEGKSPF